MLRRLGKRLGGARRGVEKLRGTAPKRILELPPAPSTPQTPPRPRCAMSSSSQFEVSPAYERASYLSAPESTKSNGGHHSQGGTASPSQISGCHH